MPRTTQRRVRKDAAELRDRVRALLRSGLTRRQVAETIGKPVMNLHRHFIAIEREGANMAFDDEKAITVEHDDLLGKHEQWAQGELENASDAGTRRQQMKQFQEDTGVNGKALSHIRAGLKIKKEGDQLDWLRSMELMLPMVANHIRGQSTEEMNLG